MPKFIVDLWMDGYESEEEMNEACKVFIQEQLNFSGSSVKIEEYKEPKTESVENYSSVLGCKLPD